MKSMSRSIVLIAALLFCGCASAQKGPAASYSDWWVGAAMLKADGTIVIKAASTQEDGMIAHLYVEYPVGHEEYEEILSHIGEAEVGVWVSIPPFSDG